VARLRRVDSTDPGIRRLRCGRGFRYVDETGRTLADADELERLRALAIPPAWTEVWICPDPLGHVQATGHDDAGRKQYLYHERWRRRREREKFDQALAFARELPAIRRRVRRDLRRRGLVRERVLGCGIRLLDLGLFRVGGEEYAEQNGTYGLATLRRRHLRFERGRAVFAYPAKGGERLVQEIADPLVLPTLRALARRRGAPRRLFAYRNGREWHEVRADRLNDHLKLIGGGAFSAKDFRTWNATVLMAVKLAAREPQPGSKTARERAIREAVAEVAEHLGNTPAVCRRSYVDPRVIDRFRAGETIEASLRGLAAAEEGGTAAGRTRIEAAVLELIG